MSEEDRMEGRKEVAKATKAIERGKEGNADRRGQIERIVDGWGGRDKSNARIGTASDRTRPDSRGRVRRVRTGLS